MSVDWAALFSVNVPVLELVVRGTCMYWFLFVAFRFVLRRDIGALGVADVLLLVIVADASQNAMAGEYKTISEGMLLVGTILGWNLLIDYLAFHVPALGRFARPRSRPLVRDGRLLAGNLAKELMTRSELEAKLRQHGVEDLRDVRMANLESDGKVSVVAAEPKQEGEGEGGEDDDSVPR